MVKKRKPRWAKKHLTNAQVVARLAEAFKYDGDKTCICKFCILAKRVARERKVC